jgi:hypothetical protein
MSRIHDTHPLKTFIDSELKVYKKWGAVQIVHQGDMGNDEWTRKQITVSQVEVQITAIGATWRNRMRSTDRSLLGTVLRPRKEFPWMVGTAALEVPPTPPTVFSPLRLCPMPTRSHGSSLTKVITARIRVNKMARRLEYSIRVHARRVTTRGRSGGGRAMALLSAVSV